MPSTSIDNCAIRYEVMGEGIPVVITGGGREGLEDALPLAEKLARTRRVVLWDRACVGQSDIAFGGASDLEFWSTQLATLLARLGAAPAYLFGCSNGARVALATARRCPDVVKGMFLTLITGSGERPARMLSQLYADAADAVEAGGMMALAELPYWAEQIGANPANRGRLQAMDAHETVRTMRRWVGSFDPHVTILGASDHDLSRIATRTRILDITEMTGPFKRKNRELADRMPNAELFTDEQAQAEWTAINEKFGIGSGHYTSIPRLADLIDAFIEENEGVR